MIYLFFSIALLLPQNLFAECESNYIGSIERVEEFILKAKASTEDASLFSEIFDLPVKIKSKSNNSYNLTTKAELKLHHHALLAAGLRDIFLNMNTEDVFCNFQGAMISNIWINAEVEQGSVKIIAVNEPLDDIAQLQSVRYDVVKDISEDKITEFLNLSRKQTGREFLGLRSDEQFTRPQDSSVPGKLLVGDHLQFRLYYADINNDESSEFILTYINSGRLSYSGIVKVFQIEKNQFIDMGFTKLNHSTRPYLGEPFLFIKDEKVHMNFRVRQVNFTSLWSRGKIVGLGVLK